MISCTWIPYIKLTIAAISNSNHFPLDKFLASVINVQINGYRKPLLSQIIFYFLREFETLGFNMQVYAYQNCLECL